MEDEVERDEGVAEAVVVPLDNEARDLRGADCPEEDCGRLWDERRALGVVIPEELGEEPRIVCIVQREDLQEQLLVGHAHTRVVHWQQQEEMDWEEAARKEGQR
jgi:hypothetical protein